MPRTSSALTEAFSQLAANVRRTSSSARSGDDRLFSRRCGLRSRARRAAVSPPILPRAWRNGLRRSAGRSDVRVLRKRRRHVLQQCRLSATSTASDHRARARASQDVLADVRRVRRRAVSLARPPAFSRSKRASDAAAMLICEDVWHAIMPTIAAVKGARIIIVPSASPGRGIEGDGELDVDHAVARDSARDRAPNTASTSSMPGLSGFEGGKGMTGSSSRHRSARRACIVQAPATRRVHRTRRRSTCAKSISRARACRCSAIWKRRACPICCSTKNCRYRVGYRCCRS